MEQGLITLLIKQFLEGIMSKGLFWAEGEEQGSHRAPGLGVLWEVTLCTAAKQEFW